MKTFLFSVDLEEFVAADRRQDFRRTPLAELTETYLDFLRRHAMKATFFVVGEIAEKFPALIRAIAAEGHELGCHTHTHWALDRHTPQTLREDLLRNREAMQAASDQPLRGFRAPILSLTERTRWAYAVLAETGFTYSSSVLPARNPLHGWPGFGPEVRRVDDITELPIATAPVFGREFPIAAGTYFRCLPFFAIRRAFRQLAAQNRPLTGYFHPYDLDTAQEVVMNEGVRGRRLMNRLLYFNRARTLPRLEAIVADGFQILPCHEYLEQHAALH
jgi:polysaccharide deacetylase family protein (PEP-CTERM system associated)